MAQSAIEWVTYWLDGRYVQGYTYNPWWGCTKKDSSCLHCYAETWSARFGKAVWGHDTDRGFVREKTRLAPLRWQREAQAAGEVRLVFCGSMMDILEPRSDLDDARLAIWTLIESTPNLMWLLLTKRPEQFDRLLPAKWLIDGFWPANVMPGISAGTQTGLAFRWPFLAALPAPAVFLSLEPIIEPLSLDMTPLDHGEAQKLLRAEYDAEEAAMHADRYGGRTHDGIVSLADAKSRGLETWVIAGGESGRKARPMHPVWPRRLRDQTHAAGLSYFFKQWGEWLPKSHWLGKDYSDWGALTHSGQFFRATSTWNGHQEHPDYDEEVTVYKVGKRAAGMLLDGQIHRRHPLHLYRYIEGRVNH
jgi:protein gp37